MKKYLLLLLSVSLMGKPIIDFHDSNIWGFNHHLSYERPDFIFMTQGKNSHVIVLSDLQVQEAQEMRKQGYEKIVAYLMEPRSFNGSFYNYVETNMNLYDLILTFDGRFLAQYPDKCKFVPAVVPDFIKDQKLHEKSQLCSFVSGKTEELEGHLLRKAVYQKFSQYFNVCKTDATPRTEWKDEFIDDFCFSVAIENSRVAHYFTEKILDCFRAGTIPIYWGCPSIGEFFDEEGIIRFHSLDQLEQILENLSFEEYERRLSAVERNFKLVADYPGIHFRDSSTIPCTIDAIWPHIRGYFPEDL